ncbi:hypothetical protein [Roseiconus lacunae]|uniref:Secreted protein n=1 Tax=Roseiconus lacunae TaxID=2605694 RepID=A0ABT7PHV2_9BACT|nr:hypothetical protein [Roseiconus lacunae]MCD0461245.1 hypothetical protein [Roseiconus lacunae]MDM4016072.1 hypothetical protein [Roseiconus lacunae]WRQ51595.1 hypothetical protein U8335_03445 [Stieleria sp. HD01]
MKKLIALVLLLTPMICLTGCGDSGNKVIEPPENGNTLSDDQMAEYEEQMRSGQGSSGPGN